MSAFTRSRTITGKKLKAFFKIEQGEEKALWFYVESHLG